MRDDNTVSKKLLDSLENVMLKRFPTSESVKRYFSSQASAPATEKGESVLKRYRDIIRQRRGSKAVSYTHLDVYKRQIRNKFIFWFNSYTGIYRIEYFCCMCSE